MRTWGTMAVRVVFVFMPLTLVACQTLIRPCGPDGECETGRWPALHLAGPPRYQAPTMHSLACDLDHLERHIDCYGSVVAKVPDVWGQARLTQYREEFEKVMALDAYNFAFVLNASESRSDQTYLASATALSFAAQPKPPVIGNSSSSKGNAVDLTASGKAHGQLTPGAATGGFSLSETGFPLPAPPAKPPAPKVQPIDLGDPGTMVSDTDKVINRNPAVVSRIGFQGAGGTIGIEPTELLAQKQRYLNFLQHIRRENEGDDTADSPGYSLNLMRIPVSVLPGKKTDVGFGAEVTMTITPILGRDLLPVTFRSLVTNDLIDHLAFPLTNLLDKQDIQNGKFLTEENHLALQGLELLECLSQRAKTEDKVSYVNKLPDGDKRRLCAAINLVDPPDCWPKEYKPAPHVVTNAKCKDQEELKHCYEILTLYICKRLLDPPITGIECAAPKDEAPCIKPPMPPSLEKGGAPNDGAKLDPRKVATTPMKQGLPQRNFRQMGLRKMVPNFLSQPGRLLKTGLVKPSKSIEMPGLPFSNGLLARQPFPTSLILEVYGIGNSFEIAFGVYSALKDEIDTTKYVHLPNVQTYLREELNAAYQFLNTNPELWGYCDQYLADAVKGRRSAYLDDRRTAFRHTVAAITDHKRLRDQKPYLELPQYSKTAALSWCIIVEAALLTDRLQQDMKELASSKKVSLPFAGQWLNYFAPDPSESAREAFNDYVKYRWPIHVFALDPYIQEQNVADSLSTRNEMQLALAIAFTNGMISARNMTKYTRRLEAEYETIALNRTQVGFSHGENTFGWRFYPRYQTPDTPGNFENLFRNQLIGGPSRNQLLRQRRLEPGVRECVAIVMMPSFVPYLTVDTVSNWFPLTNPKHKCLDTAQAMRLSRTVQTFKEASCNVRDACDFRPGEQDRLVRKAEQLEARLPTQTLSIQVPQLNTLGGFEMFNHGVADLAPELFGFYGAPGISPDKDTALFLVGDHFSPLHTKVIVGNQAIVPAGQSMLSRQVMQVIVPANTLAVKYDDGTAYARIHCATPYGVSTEIEVPIISKPEPKPGFSFGTAKMVASYGLMPDGTGKFIPVPKPHGNDSEVKITWNSPGGLLSAYVAIEMTFEYTPAGVSKPIPLKVPCRGAVLGGTTAKEIVIPKESLDIVAAELVHALARYGPFPMNPNPLDAGMKTKTVTITPLVPPGTVAQVATTVDSLSVQFKAEGVCFGDSLNTNLAPISPALSAVAGVPVAASIVPCGPFMPPAPPIIGYPVPPPPFFPADSPPTVILPDCWPRPIIPCPVPIPMAPPIHGSALPHPTQCEPGTPGKK